MCVCVCFRGSGRVIVFLGPVRKKPFDLLIYWVISARLEVWALGIETSARIQPLYLHARKHPEPGPHLRTSAFTAPPVFHFFSKLPKFICDKGTPLSRGRDCPPTALSFVVCLVSVIICDKETPLSRGGDCPPLRIVLRSAFSIRGGGG